MWRAAAWATTLSLAWADRLSTTRDAERSSTSRTSGRAWPSPDGTGVPVPTELAVLAASSGLIAWTKATVRSGLLRRSSRIVWASPGSATITTRSRSTSVPRPAETSPEQKRYQGTRMIADPATTNRGSRASPTASCTSEMAKAPVTAPATAEMNAARGVRGRSGRPMP